MNARGERSEEEDEEEEESVSLTADAINVNVDAAASAQCFYIKTRTKTALNPFSRRKIYCLLYSSIALAVQFTAVFIISA